MSRTTSTAALLVLVLCGCGRPEAAPRPRVQITPAAIPPATADNAAVREAAAGFLRSYLRAEVGRDRPADRVRLRVLSTAAVATAATARPRPTNRGFPPQAHLRRLRLLPISMRGHWIIDARTDRAGHPEHWELHFASSARGPLVTAFLTTAPTPGVR